MFSFVEEYLPSDMFIIFTFSITSWKQCLMEWDYRHLIHTMCIHSPWYFVFVIKMEKG